MATAVYTTEEILLNDGETIVTLKPLNLKKLRTFMSVMGGFSEISDELQGFDVFIEACKICIGDQIADKDIEELIDMPTITRILDVCGGIKIDDPNLIAQTAALDGQI